jgi:hypothetical protein
LELSSGIIKSILAEGYRAISLFLANFKRFEKKNHHFCFLYQLTLADNIQNSQRKKSTFFILQIFVILVAQELGYYFEG